MTATETAHPAPISLPGQTHAAPGPHDMSGMYLAHHAFRRDLRRFAAAARNTPVDDAATWQALDRRWTAFATILHHHHTVEDEAIWPPLLARVAADGEPGDRATLEAMEAEHDLIDPQLEACAEGFAAMAAAPSSVTREKLAADTAAIRDSLAQHLEHEETEALPLVQRHLTTEECEHAEKRAGSGVSLKQLAFVVPWMAEELDPAVIERVLAQAGAPMRVVLALTRGRFAKLERVAFRYV
jgi:hemerythrin-like domain-containing protein